MRWLCALLCLAGCTSNFFGTDYNLADADRAICWPAGGTFRCVVQVRGGKLADAELRTIDRAPKPERTLGAALVILPPGAAPPVRARARELLESFAAAHPRASTHLIHGVEAWEEVRTGADLRAHLDELLYAAHTACFASGRHWFDLVPWGFLPMFTILPKGEEEGRFFVVMGTDELREMDAAGIHLMFDKLEGDLRRRRAAAGQHARAPPVIPWLVQIVVPDGRVGECVRLAEALSDRGLGSVGMRRMDLEPSAFGDRKKVLELRPRLQSPYLLEERR